MNRECLGRKKESFSLKEERTEPRDKLFNCKSERRSREKTRQVQKIPGRRFLKCVVTAKQLINTGFSEILKCSK